MAELQERINQFLFDFEQLEESDVNQYVTQIAADTGVSETDVHKVLDAVLSIMEGKKFDKGIEAGQAFPAHLIRTHSLRRRYWGGQ